MSKMLTVTEMARSFAEYINRVAYRRERFILTRGKRPIAEIRPLPVGRKLSELPAIMASLPPLDPHDIEAFATDVYGGIESMRNLPVRDAWED
jgi:antitoxin (DNA-binding transcriptional repressor) of toxin-antitoxin stability system